MREWGRRQVWTCVVAAALAHGAPAAAQDEVLQRLRIDRLRLSALGAEVGGVWPAHMYSAVSYSVLADYGEISPRWRVVFGATYWASELRDRVVRAYADSLRAVVEDPSGDDRVPLGRITYSDVALAADARRTLIDNRWFRPFLGVGLVGHVMNAEGRLIDGTFVERALDNVMVGVGAGVGFDSRLISHFSIGMHARFDLLSNVRYASLRAGARYHFDSAPRGPGRAP